jgi:hypothetical protein
MLIYVKIIKINLNKKTFFLSDGQTDRQTHVQLKTIVRDLIKKLFETKKIFVSKKF